MRLHNLNGRGREGYTTWGCIWPKGAYKKGTQFELYSEDEDSEDGLRPVAMQSRVTAYWPDGSIKWTAHTADAGRLAPNIRVEAAQAPETVGMPETREMSEPGEIFETAEKAENSELSESGARVSGMRLSAAADGLLCVSGGRIRLEYDGTGRDGCLFRNLYDGDRLVLSRAEPVLLLEEPVRIDGCEARIQRPYTARISEVYLEEEGPLAVVICWKGDYRERFPFAVRMRIGLSDRKMDFVHTFFFRGDEDRDFLKGIGIRFRVPMKGAVYNRHIKVQTDCGVFHESPALLLGWKRKMPPGTYERQIAGGCLSFAGAELEAARAMTEEIPLWDTYEVYQDSVSHFGIRKKIRDENCCFIDCLDGIRSRGAISVGSEEGHVSFAIRDFWEKYPSGYTVTGMTEDEAEATVWLWPPKAEAMDFRHYANRGYNKIYYEGFDFKGADPSGIGCTSEFSLAFGGEIIPSDTQLCNLSKLVDKPPQYVGDPEYYHSLHAFGRWSLQSGQTGMEQWLERQLEKAFAFYEREVEQRQWYGMFHYGDIMHSYDRTRHVWKYDMGGYAWDNTELAPTLWLWLYFLRTGREDVFSMAERMTRHTSEVDTYHFGRYQGLGSRHNVRHWGCPCKEARIAMAEHHRVFYYLTGDWRMGDIFEELKDAEKAFLSKDPLESFYPKEKMVYPSHARSGPDWSSLCANWLVRWERFNDISAKKMIQVGIDDISRAPLQLVSGPDFEFDPNTVHLRYIGENAAGGTHLQICMGAPQIWIELAELLEDEKFEKMLADYGRFYYLDREKQQSESGGLIGGRQFTFPFMAAAMGAYAAWYRKDESLARRTWGILLGALLTAEHEDGFDTVETPKAGNRERLTEIPWISTNFTAQWCLNVIMALEFIRPQLPKTLKEGLGLAAEYGDGEFGRA